MTQPTLAELAQQFALVIAPLVAGGALGRIGEAGTDAAAQALGRGWKLLKQRFHGDSKAEATLTLFEDDAEDLKMQKRLAKHIETRFANDQTAIAELASLLGALQPQAPVGPPIAKRYTQRISGKAQVGHAHVGDFHGNLTLGPIDFSRKTVVAAGGRQPAQAEAPTERGSLPATLSADGVHFTAGHALIIGVGAYQAWNVRQVPATVHDATELAALLGNSQVAAYHPEHIQVLSNSTATKQRILDALDAFAGRVAAASQPTAVIFFAGHGKQTEQGYFLLPYDYDSSRIAETAISATEFHTKIAAIQQHATRLVVLLNCCHAGGIGDDVLDASNEPDADTPSLDFLQPLTIGSGQVVISASKAGQKSGARSTATPTHTVFGAQLLAALRGGAPGDDAGIGVLDLFAYLSKHVPADARKIKFNNAPLAQHPLLYAHQVDQNFALALRPNWHGGTLDSTYSDLVTALAEVEIRLAAYDHEDDAPSKLVRQRDQVLEQLGMA